MRTFISVVLIVLLSVINTLLSYFTFSYTILIDPNYWLEQLITQIPIVIIILVMRSLFKQRELTKNDEIISIKKIIDTAYETIHTSVVYLNSFKAYIRDDNHRRKLEAYYAILERGLLRCEKVIMHITSVTEHRKHRLELRAEKKRLLTGRETSAEETSILWRVRLAFYALRLSRAEARKALLETRKNKAAEIIDYIRIRYNEVSYATLFTDRERVQADTRDLNIHERRDVGTLLGTKILGIVAVGVLFSSTFVFSMDGEALDIVYSIVFKLLQTALAIYTGATSGTLFVRNEVALRFKLRVAYLQEFFAAQSRSSKASPQQTYSVSENTPEQSKTPPTEAGGNEVFA